MEKKVKEYVNDKMFNLSSWCRKKEPLHEVDETKIVDTFLDQSPAERIEEMILAGRSLAAQRGEYLNQLYNVQPYEDDGRYYPDEEMDYAEKYDDFTREKGIDPSVIYQRALKAKERIIEGRLEEVKRVEKERKEKIKKGEWKGGEGEKNAEPKQGISEET